MPRAVPTPAQVLERFGVTNEAAASDAQVDSQITALIRKAIQLQESDPDAKTDDSDRRVLGALRQALIAQEADNRDESAGTGTMTATCPMCDGSGKVSY